MRIWVFITMLLISSAVAAQNSSIKGKVTTKDGEKVADVVVAIHSLKKSTSTNEDGVYLLSNIKPGTYTVTLSRTGLETLEKTITLGAGETSELSFSLKETAKQLDEVVITTDKTTIKRVASFGKADLLPLDNPQSVGIISNTVIKDQQALRLGDIIKNISGVSLTQQRQGVAETFSARGYSIGVGGGTGSIFKNGITTNTGGFPEASTLESVEVLKGSSALLYGNTSAGLVINMVTKKPKFDWGGEVSMQAGSYDLYKPIFDVYGPLSKNIAFRVVGTYEHSRSFRDVVKTERKYINPSFLFKLGKNSTLLVQGDYLDANFTPDNGIGILNAGITAKIPASRSRFINTPWAWYHSKTASASAEFNHTFNESWKLNAIVGGQSVDINSYGTAVPNSIDSTGKWARALSRAGSLEKNMTIQANVIGRFQTGKVGHQVLFGTDFFYQNIRNNNYMLTNASGKIGTAYDTINILNPSLYIARTDIPTATDTSKAIAPSNRIGYYVQDLVSITNQLKVMVGLRWSNLQTLATKTYRYPTDTVVTGTASVYSALSPKAAIIYEPLQNMSFALSYANSFTANTGQDIYGNSLPPSYIKDYEFNWKNFLLGGKIAANLSVYRIINSNIAQTALFDKFGNANTNTNIKELMGQTTSDGFDIEISGTLSKNVYFILGYGYNNARYTDSKRTAGAVLNGEKLNNNPQNTANGTVFYTFTNTALKGLKLGVTTFYTGNRFGGNQNTYTASGNLPKFNNQIPLSGFATVDLSAGYSWNRFSALLKLSNIFNTLNYLAHDRYSINPIPPRQLIGTISYRF